MTFSLQNLTEDLQVLWLDLVSVWTSFDASLEDFIYYYPLFMAYIWMFGALIFYFRFEWRQQGNSENLPELTEFPPVSILIPCYNEADNIRETIEILLEQG